MKEAQFWQEEDLNLLIRNRHEESIGLDYKRADSLHSSDGKKTEISKDVSAFANSIGGTILYGMEENPTAPHYAAALSPIDSGAYSKEWLEQVINSRIHPRISGIVINSIELKTAAPGKFAYAVVVPESTTAHQAFDKRYYKRFNFESIAMEDYEVRQVMNRTSRPAYTVRLERQGSGSTNIAGGVTYLLRGIVQNLSEMVGHDVSVVAFVPRVFVHCPDDYTVNFGGTPYTRMFSVDTGSLQHTAIPGAHPLTPYSVNFVRNLLFPDGSQASSSFQAIVKVFDQFGLATTTVFRVTLPNCGIESVDETHAAKRSPSVLAAGRLE